ncbi:MAG: lysophospholipid acyltransferase family protein [Bacteroidota bacterium]
MIKTLRGWFRFCLFIALVLTTLASYMLKTLFKGRSLDEGLRMRHKFAHRLPKLTGMNIEFQGKPHDKPALYIGNHRSYYDPGAASMHLPKSVIVAKADIADWPLLGYATDLAGVIFVDRFNKDSRAATREAMAKALKDGYSVLIYPEGTIGDHVNTLPFKPGTFATAIKMGVPIVPMAVEYKVVRDAWVSADEPFVTHLVEFWSKKRTHMKVRYGEPIYGKDVDKFLEECKAWIDENLKEMQEEWGGVDWPGTALPYA